MWHFCKQRACAFLGLQKFVFRPIRKPFGSANKKHSCKPNFHGYSKFLPCKFFSDQGTDENGQRTFDDHSKKHYQQLHYCPLLETLSWVGTALVLGLNYRLCVKTQNATEKKESNGTSCFCKATNLLLHLAFSMPRLNILESGKNELPLKVQLRFLQASKVSVSKNSVETDNVSKVEAASQALEDVTCEYYAELENLAGLELIKTDKRKAFSHFLKASELGSMKGHFNVGICYETGQGTKINYKKAAYHYSTASDSGHSFAAYNLGLFFMEGRDGIQKQPYEGLKLLKKAADLGVANAQYILGICYQEGWEVEQNLEIAKEFLNKAASLEHQGAIDAIADLSTREDNIEQTYSVDLPNKKSHVLKLTPDSEDIKVSSNFHVSASSPNLCTDNIGIGLPKKMLKSYEIAISRYLDVILPYRYIGLPEHSEENFVNVVDIIPKVPAENVSGLTICVGL